MSTKYFSVAPKASDSTPVDPYAIHEVTVLGFESPVVGKTAGELSNLRVPDDAHYTLDPDLRDNNRSHWIEYNESALENDDTFAAGVFYMEGAWLVADEGYYFANDCTFTALDQNGSPKQTRSGDTGVHVESNIYAYMWTAYERPDTPPTTYTVTFDATGGTCDTATMTTGADGKLAELPTATPDGTDGVFHGWFTEKQNGDIITTNTVFEEDATVYALFSYPITVVGGKGIIGDVGTDMIATCPAGKTVTLRVDEEQIPGGKVFDKWVVTEGSFTVTDPENADGATFTSVTEKMTVTATYKNARPGKPGWPFHPGKPITTTINPDTGANDVVGVAAALAVVALVSGAAISLKK